MIFLPCGLTFSNALCAFWQFVFYILGNNEEKKEYMVGQKDDDSE
jgi:hypothetical protein